MEKARRYCYKEGLPFGAMIAVESAGVCLNTLFKAATSKGLSYHVFMVYTYGISALTLLPLCFILYWKQKIPPLTCRIVARFFALGVFLFGSELLLCKGIEYSSPTLSSAMSTITPAATFIFALIFRNQKLLLMMIHGFHLILDKHELKSSAYICRMEKLEIKKSRSQLKIVGTILTIAGAIAVVLYKGPVIINNNHSSSFISLLLSPPTTERFDWIKGGVLLVASYSLSAIWYIFQAKAVNEYPSEMVVVFFLNVSCCFIATLVCVNTEPNLSAWILKADVRLFSCLASGIIGTGISTIIVTWGLRMKGATYISLFKPLSVAIAAILGVLFLGDNLYIGSIIGAVVISMGFYIVIWGKSQEEEVDVGDDIPIEDSNVPLLTQIPR